MHPVAFKIKDFPIYWYGLMTVISYLVVMLVMTRTRKLEDLDMDTAMDCTIYAIAGGVSGARLAYALLNIKDYIKAPLSIFNIREGGLSWFGALVGGFLGIYILSKVKKMSLGKLTDFTAAHGLIALAVGRIGCFLNGCCYGRECTAPWAVSFKEAGLSGLRHPTQLYETFLLVTFFLLVLLWWKRKKFDGEISMIAFTLFGLARFIIEFFRDNTPDQYINGSTLSLAQYFSLLLIIVFPVIIFIKRKKFPASEEINKSNHPA